jgi:hypothetical protein
MTLTGRRLHAPDMLRAAAEHGCEFPDREAERKSRLGKIIRRHHPSPSLPPSRSARMGKGPSKAKQSPDQPATQGGRRKIV